MGLVDHPGVYTAFCGGNQLEKKGLCKIGRQKDRVDDDPGGIFFAALG